MNDPRDTGHPLQPEVEIRDHLPDEIALPVVPVRGTTLFPHALVPLTLGRPATLAAVDAAGPEGFVAVITQRDGETEAPTPGDLYRVGCAGRILRTSRPSQKTDSIVAFVEGAHRLRMRDVIHTEPFLMCTFDVLYDLPAPNTEQLAALHRNVRDLYHEVIGSSPNLPDELIYLLHSIEDSGRLSDLVAATFVGLDADTRQELLETVDVETRLRRLTASLIHERESQRLRDEIREEVKGSLARNQRELILREQMRAIQEELGEADDGESDIAELERRLAEADLPERVLKSAERELRRLRAIPPASPEYSVTRTWLDWLAALPWMRGSDSGRVDIARAAEILDEDHYGLEQVKERILEHLAVLELVKEPRAPIICFVGPPGVGKTSLGRSIARAIDRPFVRIALGGTSDEAEIRGHRRTYVGALPGQIIHNLRRAETNDPVFMLDEVDKLGKDFRGDPASALLEVLDPEQNNSFLDRYIDIPFDLSNVFFITTANTVEPVPQPLLDRMEVIELPGYVEEEKLEIARRYLIPKQRDRHGLREEQLRFADDAVRHIISRYTREAGVRLLEQKIARVCRKRARQVVAGESAELELTRARVPEILGAPRYRVESEIAERTSIPGVGVALAWTPAGGEILFVEATRMKGDGKGTLTITGQVRQVMQESARAASSWLRAHAVRLGFNPDDLRQWDVHIHVPSGAVPKDGPSAGIVMVAALTSLHSGRPLGAGLAMTGEITLSGLVLPIGGIKEKVLAARRYGIHTVILPAENEPNVLDDVPKTLREQLDIRYVKTIDEALEHAFDHERPYPFASRPSRDGEVMMPTPPRLARGDGEL